MKKTAFLSKIRGLRLVVPFSLLVLVLGILWISVQPPQSDSPSKIHPPVPTTSPATSANGKISPLPLAAVASAHFTATNEISFRLRPFPAGITNDSAAWTAADGKDTNVIRLLAHNQLEYDRMVAENPTIFRRQLVYLKTTPASVFEAAKLTGKPVTELTLPGLDGQELPFQIVSSQNNDSSRHGMFSGHLVGNLNSTVTLAYQDGREAFTIISPADNLFLIGEPREDGQVIVKAIDPNTYGRPPQDAEADDFIPTASAQR